VDVRDLKEEDDAVDPREEVERSEHCEASDVQRLGRGDPTSSLSSSKCADGVTKDVEDEEFAEGESRD
jgi:hypothetical protein